MPLPSHRLQGMEVSERESPRRWAGVASWPRVTSQHHVISLRSERLSSCLASPGLGMEPGLPARPVPRSGGDGHLGSTSISAGCGVSICSGGRNRGVPRHRAPLAHPKAPGAGLAASSRRPAAAGREAR